MTGPRTQFEMVYRPLIGPLFSTAGFQEIKREPIPWCTTHNTSVGAESSVCDYGDLSGHGGCVISTGGPDHKWWRDV